MDEKFAIARAWRGQPFKGIVVIKANGLIYLINPSLKDEFKDGTAAAVGFPPDDVFEFDEVAFAELRRRWEKIWPHNVGLMGFPYADDTKTVVATDAGRLAA